MSPFSVGTGEALLIFKGANPITKKTQLKGRSGMSCAMPRAVSCDPRKGCYTRLRRGAATPAFQKQKALDNDKEDCCGATYLARADRRG
ncbi:hypothetical protein IBA8401_34180 [Pseudomonas syringae]